MKTREKRFKRRRQRVREDILDVARELMLKHGVGDLTLTAIADELQLTKGALYYYFASKDALLFDLIYGCMSAEVDAVETAVETATNGADAVERLIRAVADHYAVRRDEFCLVYLAGQVGSTAKLDPEFLARIRPLNDRTYGRAERLITADQAAGIVASDVDARRTPFLAHCATLGVLMIEGMIEAGDTSPLIHAHDALIDDLVLAHTARLRT